MVSAWPRTAKQCGHFSCRLKSLSCTFGEFICIDYTVKFLSLMQILLNPWEICCENFHIGKLWKFWYVNSNLFNIEKQIKISLVCMIFRKWWMLYSSWNIYHKSSSTYEFLRSHISHLIIGGVGCLELKLVISNNFSCSLKMWFKICYM
jgi:hypothetical protein